MERFTEKDENGYYIAGDTIYGAGGDTEKFRGDAIDRFAHYEDLEEQGRLVELPVAVGANIYNIFIPDVGRMRDGSIVQGIPRITTGVFNWDNIGYVRKLWGKRVFATKQEAVLELERCGYADYYDLCENEFEKHPSSEAAIAASGKEG